MIFFCKRKEVDESRQEMLRAAKAHEGASKTYNENIRSFGYNMELLGNSTRRALIEAATRGKN